MATKTKKKPTRKISSCSRCGNPGHRRNKCSEYEIIDLSNVPLKKVELVVDAPKPDEVMHKCAYQLCRNLISKDQQYCSNICNIFNTRRIEKMAQSKSKYKPEYSEERLFEYLQLCELSHNPKYIKDKEMVIPIKQMQLPSIEGYASFIGFHAGRLHEWSKVHPEMREAMSFLNQIQKVYLMNGGISNAYNSKIASLLLMSRHGMAEKRVSENNHMIGVVRQFYEIADNLEKSSAMDDPFEGILSEEDEDEDNV